MTKNIGILFKLRYYVSINTVKQQYYTLTHPYLNYGLMSLGKITQNNCLRCIFFANKRESPTTYFTLLEILKLENIFKLKIGSLVHKIQYQKKKKHLSLSMIWLNRLLQSIIIIPGMPLIKTF